MSTALETLARTENIFWRGNKIDEFLVFQEFLTRHGFRYVNKSDGGYFIVRETGKDIYVVDIDYIKAFVRQFVRTAPEEVQADYAKREASLINRKRLEWLRPV